jgi:hypothetical protein
MNNNVRKYPTKSNTWLVVGAPTTNTDTHMPDFNNPVMDPDEEGLNTSRNILDDEEPKFYRQAISGPNADLWDSAIQAEMDALRRNHVGFWRIFSYVVIYCGFSFYIS